VRNVRKGTMGSDGRRSRNASRRGGAAGALAAVVLALAFAAPAWAGSAATATLAPIGTGSYLLTVTNISPAPLSGFFAAVQTPFTAGVAPAPACKIGQNTSPIEVDSALICNVTIAAGASIQVCYTGPPPGEIFPDGNSTMQLFMLGTDGANGSIIGDVTLAPAVASCPLAGFIPGVGASGGSGTGTGSGSTPSTSSPAPSSPAPSTPAATTPAKRSPTKITHAWKRAACVSSYKSWKKSHKHASTKQRTAEQSKLKTQHGCALSALK